MSVNPWNSLEITKIFVNVITPVSVVVVGWLINSRLKRLDHIQWSNQKLIEKRLALYDEVSPLLNTNRTPILRMMPNSKVSN